MSDDRAISRGDATSLRERLRARTGRAELLLFRVGHERFAVELAMVEEAVDLGTASVHSVPGQSGAMLGIVRLRGALIPMYAAAVALRAGETNVHTALVFRTRGGRVALAVDDAEDVVHVDLVDVRAAPHTDDDAIVLGVLQQGKDLIGILDGEALLTACHADPSLESL